MRAKLWFHCLCVGLVLSACGSEAKDETAKASEKEAAQSNAVEAQPKPEPKPAEPEGPTPEKAAKQLQALDDDADLAKAEELIRTAMKKGGECTECVEAVIAVARKHRYDRVIKSAMRALVDVKGHDDAICGLYLERLKARQDASPSAAAISVLGRRQGCSEHYDAATDEITTRFEAPDDTGTLTAGYIVYVKRFVESDALTDDQKQRIIDSAKTLARKSEGAIAKYAKEIASL